VLCCVADIWSRVCCCVVLQISGAEFAVMLCCRYLEQSRDSPFQTLVMTLQHEKEKISAELSEALSHVNSLEVSVCAGLID
jgi:hypothetical protein